MRIISKFKDYYDGALRFGQDSTIVFVRDNQHLDPKLPEYEVLRKELPRFNIGTKTKGKTTISFSPVVAVFCGKTYRGFKLKRTTAGEPPFGIADVEVKVFYNLPELEAYLALYEMKIAADRRYFWQVERNGLNLQEFLGAQGTTELMDFCIANRFVTLTYSERSDYDYNHSSPREYWSANGKMSDVQFFKVFDAYSCYQELDMFISGTLPQSTAMPIEIADKDRIAQHGFDKYSFRKPKQK
jgi:hypothetical protein